MNSKIKPHFPVIVICSDESIYTLRSLSDWTEDVDQWYWSEGNEYILDQHSRKFIQDCMRCDGNHPDSVPVWLYSGEMEFSDIKMIVENNFSCLKEKNIGDLSELIDLVVSLDR